MSSTLQSFQWSQLGDLMTGRPQMGTLTHVNVYRLLQFLLRSVIENEFGREECWGTGSQVCRFEISKKA